ncbi:MAG TPA: response regulator [Kofleriaceae bacterium]|nr:response regulator [Kofleriaceae bacterium]
MVQRETAANSPLQLLVAEDSEDDFEILLRELRKGGYVVTAQRVKSPAELDAALDASSERPWDLVISDWIMPGFGGLQVLETVSSRGLDLACIIVSGTPGEEPAVEALRAGALDFLSKDRPRRIVPAVQRALREAADRRTRVRVERELRFSEERYRTGFELAPEPLLAYDLDRRVILDANAKASELFQRSRAELRSLDLGAISPPRQPDGRTSADALEHYTGRARAGESPLYPWIFQAHDGDPIPTDTRIINLATSGRNIAQINIIDLRERLRAEEMRRRSAELEAQNRRIQEASRLKSEFLANMSHELRTPLNAIIGFTELLHDGQVDPGSPVHHEFLGDILTSGRHLLQLINDVLDLAKVEAGKLEFRPEPVELSKLVGEVAAILRTTAAQKQIRMTIDVDARVDTVTIDPGRLKQVAYNYLSNALKFTPIGGTVALRVKPEGPDRFRLEVEDSGIGIRPEDLGRLFVEFQQLEAGAAKRHQGTGLGLALTRRLVEAQGGSVGVRSTVGAGSTFHASLPCHAITIGRTPTAPVVAAPRDGAPTVLVVEDDVRDQAQFIAALESAGFVVELAATGQDAIARWKARRYAAATIDLLLPDMSGLDLLGALRGIESNAATPIIVVTVVPDPKVVAGFTVHDVLPKPVDHEGLIASLARAGVTALPPPLDPPQPSLAEHP